MDSVSQAVRNKTAAAANYRCEYCQTAQEISGAQMQIDHILPVSRGGSSDESNLCLACAWCNSYKSAQTHGQDEQTGEEVSLFHPRTQLWQQHFCWSKDGVSLIGLTATGRVTVGALKMNNAFVVSARYHWVEAGWHPPLSEIPED